MAEIVRLLRWRAEWDGADLVDGLGKAAAAGDRLKKSVDDIGTASPAALKKVGTAAKETDESLAGLGLEAKQVEMYLGRLEKGSGSPLVLQRNAELAAAAMAVLSQSAEKAGQTIPQAFSDRVVNAIGAAKTQAEGMNAELEKMGGQTPTKLDKVITALEKTEAASARAAASMLGLDTGSERTAASTGKAAAAVSVLKDQTIGVAKSTMAASGAVGPFGELLEKLGASGTGAASSLASVGFQVLAAGAALKIGWDAGTKFNQFLEQHGNYLAKAIDGTVNWVTGLQSEEQLLTRMPIVLNTAIRARQQLAEETKKTLSELDREMGGWKNLDQVRAKALEQAKLISERYTQLKAAGKDWRAEMEMQAPAINATAETLMQLGVPLAQLPLGFVTAARHAAEFELSLKAAEIAAGANEAAVTKLAKAEADYQGVTKATAETTRKAVEAYDAKMRALNELDVSEEEYSTRKRAAYEEMAAAIEKAARTEDEAAKKLKTSQTEVQEVLDGTPEKFAEIQRAAETFNAEIEKGATPATAMKTALDELAISAASISEAGAALNTINFGNVVVTVKSTAEAAAEAGASFGTMSTGLESIVGSAGRALDALSRLANGFDLVREKAAGATGVGISNSGPGAPVTTNAAPGALAP